MVIRVLAIVATLYALVGGVITLIGWFAGFPRLTDWDGDGIAMLANAAFAASLAGCALLLLLLYSKPGAAVVVAMRALAFLVAIIGGLTLSQHIVGWNLGIDTLLVEPTWGERATVSPGRMGPPASTTYLLLGTGLVLATFHRSPGARRAAALFAVAAAVPPIVSWTAYFYGADPLYSLRSTGIARQTATFLLALSCGLILAIHEHGLGGLLRRQDAAGTLMRHLLPISIALLLVTGWLEDYGEQRGWYDRAFGNASLTVASIVMFTALLWWTARAVTLQIQRRQKVESALSETQQRFRIMVDAIPQLAWMARPDGWIYWYNQRWYEYTGSTPEDMEGSACTILTICRASWSDGRRRLPRESRST